VIKRLSDTRWSAHIDAVTALHGGFEKIQDALDALSGDTDQEVNTRCDTEGLCKKMEKLETIFLTILWNDILERVNKTSKILQSTDVDILVAMNLLTSLKTYLQEIREKFSKYELKTKSRCPDSDYSDANKRERNRSIILTTCDKSAASWEKILLHKSEKFKVETFLHILDTLHSDLKKTCRRLQMNLGICFSILEN